MSMEQVKVFYNSLGEKPEVQKKLQSLKGSYKDVIGKVGDIARAEGYEITTEDLIDFLGSSELDENLLKAVQGNTAADSNCGGHEGCTSVCGECCGTFLGTYIGKQ